MTTINLTDAFAKLDAHLKHNGHDGGCSICDDGIET